MSLLMSNIYRSYKDSDEWRRADLDSYNIHVTPQDTASFFGIPSESLPNAQVSAEILDVQEAADMANDDNAMLINLLDAAMVPMPPSTKSEESAVIDFSVQLLRYLGGYVGRRGHARTRRHLPFPISGHTKDAKIDLCIVDGHNDDIVLVVEEEKHQGTISDAEAKLIAKAIAAFAYNNECRKANGLPELQKQMMAGIVMAGTMPTFYQIPITADLVFKVRHGVFPYQRTEVSGFSVPVARQKRRWSEGMKPLDNRRAVFGCFEAFKAIVEYN